MKNIYVLNKTNGITLIALVVTIIILLILAAVTTSFVLSDNGIFNKAARAVRRHTIADETVKIIENNNEFII